MRKPWWPAVFLTALLIALYRKLVFSGSHYVSFDHYDLCQLEIPRLQFLARNIHLGHFPLWDPHLWAGLPVIGSGSPGALYPLNLLFLALPLSNGSIPVATLNWWFIAIHLIGALGMFLLCRDLRLSPAGSVLGALAFAGGGFFGDMAWFDIGNGASLTPLVFFFAFRMWNGLDRQRSATLLGLFLGFSWLSGHHEIPLVNSYAVLLVSVALFAWRWMRRRRELALLWYTALAFLLAGAVGAAQIAPLVEFGRVAKRWSGTPQPLVWHDKVPYYVHAHYSLPWGDLLGVFIPRPTTEVVFFGIAVVFLALVALLCRWRDRPVRYAALIGAGALLYSLGANTPFHRIAWALLPGIDKARTPVRGMYLVGFASCLLAAWGADALIERRHAILPSLAALTGLVAAFLVCRGAISGYQLAVGLSVSACLAILILWRVPACGLILIALTAAEVRTVADLRTTPLDRTVCAASMLDHRELIGRLRADLADGRLALNVNDVWTSPGDLYGFDQLISFVAGVPADVLKFNFADSDTQKFFGVTYFLGRAPNSPADTLVATDSMGLSLFAKSAARPRAWVEHGGQLGPEPVSMTRPNTDSVVLRTTLRSAGVVVLTDVLYPGWQASVDGRPVPIQAAYTALRGVAIDAGTHTVEMHYRPASVRLGVAVTFAGLLVCLLPFVIRRRPIAT